MAEARGPRGLGLIAPAGFGTRLALESTKIPRSNTAMLSNRLAFAALAVACIGAAAGGGYLASRHDAAPAVAQGARAPVLSTPRASTAEAVQETEAIVDETVRTPATLAAVTPARKVTASTSRHTEAASRPVAQARATAG